MRPDSTCRCARGTGSDVERRRHRHAGFWIAAAGAPVVSWSASVVRGLEPAEWLAPPAPLLGGLVADTLLLTAWAAIVGAPLMGVALGSAWRGARLAPHARGVALGALAGPLALAVCLFTVASASITALALGIDGASLAFVASSHATLAAVSLALVTLGALCGAARMDPLDAAACSAIVALTVAAGVLVLGPPVADAPRPVLEAALLASPLVAVAAAAHVDIVRMDLLYQISPLAHLTFEYPAWQAAALWHLAVAAVGLLGLTWIHRQRRAPLTR